MQQAYTKGAAMMVREKTYVDFSNAFVAALTGYADARIYANTAAMRFRDGSEDADQALIDHNMMLHAATDELEAAAQVVREFGDTETFDGLWDTATPYECSIAARWLETYRTALSFYMVEAAKEEMPEQVTQAELDEYLYRRYRYASEWNADLFDRMVAMPKQYRRMSWWVR